LNDTDICGICHGRKVNVNVPNTIVMMASQLLLHNHNLRDKLFYGIVDVIKYVWAQGALKGWHEV